MAKTRIDSWAAEIAGNEENEWSLFYRAMRCQWQEAAAWAVKEFGLARRPSRSSFYAWLKQMRAKEHDHRMHEAAIAAAEAKAKAEREASARREQEAARAAELARAQSALPGLQARAAGIRAQIDAQNASAGNANLAVFQAQGNLDVAKANGDRGGIRSASGELQAAQEAAWSVQNQTDATIKSLTEALRKVNEELKAAERVIANNRKQSSNSFAEAPAGD